MATERPRRGSDSDADLGGEQLPEEDLAEDREGDLAEDRVRDDEYARDFGDSEPADPLGQSMPDVTEAHAAEAGGPPRRTSSKEYAADDEGGRHGPPAHARKNVFGRAMDFLRASYAELRRVQWPDRRQVGQGTAVTLGFVIVAGAYLGLLDAIWNPLIQAFL